MNDEIPIDMCEVFSSAGGGGTADESLLSARQRVMSESLATVCHHLGQPATIITSCLELMKMGDPSPELMELIETSTEAAYSMREIQKLTSVSQYCSIPYLNSSDRQAAYAIDHMLEIEC